MLGPGFSCLGQQYRLKVAASSARTAAIAAFKLQLNASASDRWAMRPAIARFSTIRRSRWYSEANAAQRPPGTSRSGDGRGLLSLILRGDNGLIGLMPPRLAQSPSPRCRGPR